MLLLFAVACRRHLRMAVALLRRRLAVGRFLNRRFGLAVAAMAFRGRRGRGIVSGELGRGGLRLGLLGFLFLQFQVTYR